MQICIIAVPKHIASAPIISAPKNPLASPIPPAAIIGTFKRESGDGRKP